MSEVKVNKITPTTNCGTVTLGDSGDTLAIPCGVTLSNAGSITNSGTITNTGTISGGTITGTIDNQVNWDTTAKTAGFTAVAGNGYFVNTTSGAITVTLPATPTAGDLVGIKDYAGTSETNNITIARNGEPIQGTANNFVIGTEGLSIILIYVDGTQGWVSTGAAQASDITFPQFIIATGGTVTTCGDYKIHTFTSPGTFTVCSVGNPFGGPNSVDYMVVAGGGGGGGGAPGATSGAGGGAGGFRESHCSTTSGCYTASPLATPTSIPISATGYPISVGGGGAGGPSYNRGSNGSTSVFSTITSTGGGGGGGNYENPQGPGNPGGSGGGGSYTSSAGTGNTPAVSPPQGNPGDNRVPGRGGGGGATAAGCQGVGGAGAGTGINPSCTVGTPGPSAPLRFFAGGANGSCDTCGVSPVGGGGISPSGIGVAGLTNTGGGGGGTQISPPGVGAAGGSGIVIIRYKYQ